MHAFLPRVRLMRSRVACDVSGASKGGVCLNAYEGLFVLDADLEEEAAKQAVAAIQDAITARDGVVESVEEWGERDLAYPIRKKRKGRYVLLLFSAPPSAVAELNRSYRLMAPILRHLIVRR